MSPGVWARSTASLPSAMAPGCAAYTYLGYAGREIAVGGEAVIRKALLGLALVATIAFASRIYLRIRRRRHSP